MNLWPQMDVLLADPSRLKELTDQQRGWLREAAEDAAGDAQSLADRDDQLVAKVCDAGARMANASEADLGALRKAFAPVYAPLEPDPDTKGFISQIRALKRSTQARPGLEIPDGCTGKAVDAGSSSAGRAPAYLNGTYRYVLTQADADKVGDTDTGYPVVTTITLKDGTMKGGCFEKGTYSVVGKRITFHSDAYNTDATVTMSRDGEGNLDLTPVPPMEKAHPFNLLLQDLEEDRMRAVDSAQVAPAWRGISAVNRVPSPITLHTANVPPRVSTRSARPRRPVPFVGSAPPTPSSSTFTVARSSVRVTDTRTFEA